MLCCFISVFIYFRDQFVFYGLDGVSRNETLVYNIAFMENKGSIYATFRFATVGQEPL